MINGKKVVIVLPAYNAALTLEKTIKDIPSDLIDELILVDDHSLDTTIEVAKNLKINHIIVHESNKGYGANQKTCYQAALDLGADIILMLHPDYQYTPLLIPSLVWLIANNVYKSVIGSRIIGNGALKGGMPIHKYISNRLLTLIQNLFLNQKLSEYHTGYRAYSREILEKINFNDNSDGFIFDNELLCQIIYLGYDIGEISCPTNYFPEASSINLKESMIYGLNVILISLKFRLHKWHIISSAIFSHLD